MKPAGSAATTSQAPAAPKKISAKLVANKTSNPFATSRTRFKTPFSQEHSVGSIPVHIFHTGNIMKLAWDCKPEEADEGRLLVLASAGLSEDKHPYVFLAPALFENLISRDGIGERTVEPLLDKVAPHLRAAMAENQSFARGLAALCQVSQAVGPALNPFLPQLLQSISKHLTVKEHRQQVEDALIKLEQNGGPPASKHIKAKVPTYMPLYKVGTAKPAAKRAAFT